MTPTISDIKTNDVVLIGICSDENSSFLRGAAEAPPLIRRALHSRSANLTAEVGISLEKHPRLKDLGDFSIAPGAAEFMRIEDLLFPIFEKGGLPLILGGDHAITYPILRGVHRRHGPLNILHFDAHPDLYPELEGNRLSHACPFARIMEEGLAGRLVQVGIRTLNEIQKRQAQRFGVEIHPMRDFSAGGFQPDFDGPLYLSFDLDVLDPAFAPGVSHFEPGGLSVREALSIIHRVDQPIIAADIVEYNPQRDLHDRTAMVAAKLLKEIAAMMLRNSP